MPVPSESSIGRLCPALCHRQVRRPVLPVCSWVAGTVNRNPCAGVYAGVVRCFGYCGASAVSPCPPRVSKQPQRNMARDSDTALQHLTLQPRHDLSTERVDRQSSRLKCPSCVIRPLVQLVHGLRVWLLRVFVERSCGACLLTFLRETCTGPNSHLTDPKHSAAGICDQRACPCGTSQVLDDAPGCRIGMAASLNRLCHSQLS